MLRYEGSCRSTSKCCQTTCCFQNIMDVTIVLPVWFPPFLLSLWGRLIIYRGADKSLARLGMKQANVSIRMVWICFGALPCRKKETWWQLAPRCCWNHTRPWHASELLSFLVGLSTYQHTGNTCIFFLNPCFRSAVFYSRFLSAGSAYFVWSLCRLIHIGRDGGCSYIANLSLLILGSCDRASWM